MNGSSSVPEKRKVTILHNFHPTFSSESVRSFSEWTKNRGGTSGRPPDGSEALCSGTWWISSPWKRRVAAKGQGSTNGSEPTWMIGINFHGERVVVIIIQYTMQDIYIYIYTFIYFICWFLLIDLFIYWFVYLIMIYIYMYMYIYIYLSLDVYIKTCILL